MDDDANEIIEQAVGKLYLGFYKLRSTERYQDEYDQMGVLMNMLMTDRQYLRAKYNLEDM